VLQGERITDLGSEFMLSVYGTESEREREREREQVTRPHVNHTQWLRERGGRAVCQRWGG